LINKDRLCRLITHGTKGSPYRRHFLPKYPRHYTQNITKNQLKIYVINLAFPHFAKPKQGKSHITYDIKNHIVWITKYRKPAITGKVAERTRELIRQVCQKNEVEILSGHVSRDHIHLLVSVPPHLSVSKLVQYIKGYSSHKLQAEYKEINKEFWGQHLWARGYFAASSGNVTDEVQTPYPSV